MKIRPDVLTLVQQQVGLEEYSVRVYMEIANWCGFNGFSGAQKFFNERAQEESTHRDKIIDFLLGCNYLPELAPIPSPAYALNVLEDCINTGLIHEQKISASIKKIMETADSDPEDHVTCAFFQWFINEQREEEAIYLDLQAWCNQIGLFSDAPDWAKGMMRVELDEKLEDYRD